MEEWRKMKPEQRKELINKMSKEEKMNLLQQFRQNMLVDELDIPESKKDAFNNIYKEYQESQKNIKKRFQPENNYDMMNDDEAKKELKQSFDVGQELLDNRKKYSEKFQKVIKPQQVLKMFETEGRMRNKVIDRDQQMRQNRNNAPRTRSMPQNNGGRRPSSR